MGRPPRKESKMTVNIFDDDEPKKAPADFTSTPEFQDAVASAVSKFLAEKMPAILPAATGGDPESAGYEKLANAIAVSIAELNAQGTDGARKVIVDPAIMRQRENAHKAMMAMLIDAKQRGEKPRYRVMDTLYLLDRVIEPYSIGASREAVPVEISWSGVPSMNMRPLNSIAKRVFGLFRESIGNVEKVAPEAAAISLTQGGLIIHGAPINKRTVGGGDHDALDADAPSFAEDLEVLDNNDPRKTTRNVLGTIADPVSLLPQGQKKVAA